MGATMKITPEVFEEIKILLRYGMNQREVARRVDISPQSISRVNCADTYEEYREWANEHLGRLQKSKNEEEPNKDKAGEFYRYNQITAFLREQNKLLLRIAEAAEKIAKEL